jgi:hypothetical protein
MNDASLATRRQSTACLAEQTHGILDVKDIEEHGISSLPIRNPTSIRNKVTNLGKHI